MPNLGCMELAAPFHDDCRGCIAIFESGDRCFEIPAIGHAVGADGPPAWQFELLAIVFAHKPARRSFKHFHSVDQSARDNRNLFGLQINDPELRRETQTPLLRHDQQFTVGRKEVLILLEAVAR